MFGWTVPENRYPSLQGVKVPNANSAARPMRRNEPVTENIIQTI